MVEELPINFVTYESGQNLNFDNFFRNSFMHFYLRTKELQDLDKDMRLAISKNRCDAIQSVSKFLVGVDKEDPHVFYSYVAYTSSEGQLFLHFAYVKKNFRGFGFFKKSLEKLKLSNIEYFHTLPIKLKKKTYLQEFEKRVL